MKGFVIFILLLPILFSCNSPTINQFNGDKKDGHWVEYLKGEKEVSKDSAEFKREIDYKDGVPVGLVKDYHITANINREFYLSSEIYTKTNRPLDHFIGLLLVLDTSNNRITEWQYYDKYGNYDTKEFCIKGYDDVSKDNRFDKKYIEQQEVLGQIYTEIFKHLAGNPDEFDKVYPEVLLKAKKRDMYRQNPDSKNDKLTNNMIILMQFQNYYKDKGNPISIGSSNIENKNSDNSNTNLQKVTCPKCNGTNREVCYWCNGKGTTMKNSDHLIECPVCLGHGYRGGNCSGCLGKGYILR